MGNSHTYTWFLPLIGFAIFLLCGLKIVYLARSLTSKQKTIIFFDLFANIVQVLIKPSKTFTKVPIVLKSVTKNVIVNEKFNV